MELLAKALILPDLHEFLDVKLEPFLIVLLEITLIRPQNVNLNFAFSLQKHPKLARSEPLRTPKFENY